MNDTSGWMFQKRGRYFETNGLVFLKPLFVSATPDPSAIALWANLIAEFLDNSRVGRHDGPEMQRYHYW